jgi:hypothetical protein
MPDTVMPFPKLVTSRWLDSGDFAVPRADDVVNLEEARLAGTRQDPPRATNPASGPH